MSKKCNKCKVAQTRNAETKKIPLVAAECEATRQHQIIMYLIYAVMVLSVLLFGSNFAWVLLGGIL